MREAGFYWIRLVDKWEVAEWTGNDWYRTGIEVEYADSEIEAVGPRLEPPNEELKP